MQNYKKCSFVQPICEKKTDFHPSLNHYHLPE